MYSSILWIMISVPRPFSLESNVDDGVWLFYFNFFFKIVQLNGSSFSYSASRLWELVYDINLGVSLTSSSPLVGELSTSSPMFVIVLLLSLLWHWNRLLWRDDTFSMVFLLVIWILKRLNKREIIII